MTLYCERCGATTFSKSLAGYCPPCSIQVEEDVALFKAVGFVISVAIVVIATLLWFLK